MLTWRTGCPGAPAAAKAMAAHLLQHTLPAEQMQLAAYYGRIPALAEAAAAGVGCAPIPRADTHPAVAEALGIRPGRWLSETELASILGGRRADGRELPGQQRDVFTYAAAKSGDKTGQERVRISYTDFTFSAPKSLSVAWAFATTEAERNVLLQCHRTARDETLSHIADEIGVARLGHAGQDGTERGHLTWIACDHFTARPTVEITRADPSTGVVDTELYSLNVAGDPQLHTHCVMPNLMVTDSGRVVAINNNLLDKRIHEFGATYQLVLARELTASGYDVALCERTGTARMTAIPERVCEAFSRRTVDAEGAAREAASAAGQDWDAMAVDDRVAFLKRGAKATRQGKGDDLANQQAWRAQAERLGWQPAISFVAHGPPAPVQAPAQRLDAALDAARDLFARDLETEAVVRGSTARTAAARGLIAQGGGSIAEIAAVTRAMRDHGVIQNGQTTRLLWGDGPHPGHVQITTELHRDQELELIRLARTGAADRTHALTTGEIAAAVARGEVGFAGAAGQQQRDAMERLGTDGAVAVAIGAAGAGKTTLLTPLVAAWAERGFEVWGTAQAWRQARALEATGIAPARAKALSPLLAGLEDGSVTLGRDAVVVLDELGQLGTRDLLRLLRQREQHGFKLVAVGDDRQCRSIQAGPVIDLLRDALGADAVPQLLTTVRQESAREREIAGLLRDGNAAAAIGMKRADGTAVFAEGGYGNAVRHVAAVYRREREAHPGLSVSISAPTNADAREIGRAVREARRAMGEVGPDRARPQATDGRGGAYDLPLAEGDRIRLYERTRAVFTGDDGKGRSANIGNNGSVLTIDRVIPSQGLMAHGESGKVGFIAWEALRDAGSGRLKLGPGDCLTIDSAQGITSDIHINAMPAGSSAVTQGKAYVAESRHRVRSILVGSMGAELREAEGRRPLGAPQLATPEARADAAWANVVRNLERETLKASALEFLKAAVTQARQAAASFQRALRPQEVRRAQGLAPTVLAERFAVTQGHAAAAALARQGVQAAEAHTSMAAATGAAPKPSQEAPRAAASADRRAQQGEAQTP